MADLLGWGAGGTQLYQQEKAQEAVIEMDRVQLGINQAKAEREAAEAESEDFAAREMARIAKGDPSVPGGNVPADPAKVMETVAYNVLAAGGLNAGTELLKTASTLQKNNAAAIASEVAGRKSSLEVAVKQADYLGRVFATITPGDDEGMDAAIDALPDDVFSPEEKAHFKEFDASPEVIEHFRSMALSEKDKATLALTQDRDAATQAARVATEGNREAMRRIAEARLEETRRYNDAKLKAGAAEDVGVGSDDEWAAVNSLVMDTVLDQNMPTKDEIEEDPSLQAIVDNVNNGVTNILGRAKEIQRDEGVTFQQAMHRAAAESEAAGDWEPVMADPWYDKLPIIEGASFDTGEREYAGKGVSPAKPIKLVDGMTEDDMITGRYYTAPDGEVVRWTGTGWASTSAK